MMLGHALEHYVGLGFLLFVIGAFGFVVRRNLVIQLLCVEVMLSGALLTLVAFNRVHMNASSGQVFTLLGLAVMAAQLAVGLTVILGHCLEHQGQKIEGDPVLKR
jgi:NADH-quinone oxidoreductase subunit K